jgi:mannose-1-phosphate guanylyltransferase/mannose-6-phosphate isomerase
LVATTLIPIILSGGAGTRLWPLSREAAPKPFMPLPDGETLLGKTARRALDLPQVAHLLTVTNRDLYFHTKDVYASAGLPPTQGITYLLEPFGRNTAPAVALGALFAEAQGWRDAVLLVLPADHLIRDARAFAAAIARATALAAKGLLVTFGIAPTHPDTGFGYVECGELVMAAGRDEPPAFRARRFVEKPPLLTAREYAGRSGVDAPDHQCAGRHGINRSAGDRCCAIRGSARYFDRLRRDGVRRDGRRSRCRAGDIRLERCRIVAGGGSIDRHR